jgi:hypothetical protein
VVAYDLVELDELAADLVEPAGESLVEIGPRLLGERVVRRVADEDVPEPKRVVAGKQRLFRSHELLAHEAEQTGRDLRILRRERLNGRAVEDLPLDGAAFKGSTLRSRKLIEARREQRLDARRHRHLGVADSSIIATISSTKSGLPSAAARIRSTQPVLHVSGQLHQEPVGRLAPERLEQNGCRMELAARPTRTAVEQLRSRHAQDHDRSVTRPVGEMLDQVEESLLRPVEIVPDDDERPLTRRFLEETSHGKRDLLFRRDRVAPEQDAQRPRDPFIEHAFFRPELLDRLDHGPVGDALAVRKTPAMDNSRVEPA